MKRIRSVEGVKLGSNGRAALVELSCSDGTDEVLEIDCEVLGDLMDGLFKACAKLDGSEPQSIDIVNPHNAITIPALEIAVRENGNGGAWLLLRVGGHDFGILFPERHSRSVLAHLLEKPRSSV